MVEYRNMKLSHEIDTPIARIFGGKKLSYDWRTVKVELNSKEHEQRQLLEPLDFIN